MTLETLSVNVADALAYKTPYPLCAWCLYLDIAAAFSEWGCWNDTNSVRDTALFLREAMAFIDNDPLMLRYVISDDALCSSC